jgi:hypothetical protein
MSLSKPRTKLIIGILIILSSMYFAPLIQCAGTDPLEATYTLGGSEYNGTSYTMYDQRKFMFTYEVTSGPHQHLEIFALNVSNYIKFYNNQYDTTIERYMNFSVSASGSQEFTVPNTYNEKTIYYVIFYNNDTESEIDVVDVNFSLTTLTGGDPDDQGGLETIVIIVLVLIGALIAYGIYHKATKNKGTRSQDKKKLQKMVGDVDLSPLKSDNNKIVINLPKDIDRSIKEPDKLE